MAETANQTLYKQELIKTFERRTAKLESRVVTDGIASGANYVFLVNGSGNRSAVTRGANGRIPAASNNDDQYTCAMAEWHDKPQSTRFNIFAGQAGAQRRAAMQVESVGVLNRKADDLVIAAAVAGNTQFAGLTAEPLSAQKALHAISVVLTNNVELSPNDVTGLLTPAAFAYLVQNDLVSSKDYVDQGPLPNMPLMFKWAGIMWMIHTALPGAGTSSETLYVFHRNAIGLAKDRANMNVSAGYNDEEDYYYARASMFMGAKLLQTSGICGIRHDGSAFAATA